MYCMFDVDCISSGREEYKVEIRLIFHFQIDHLEKMRVRQTQVILLLTKGYTKGIVVTQRVTGYWTGKVAHRGDGLFMPHQCNLTAWQAVRAGS